ncbi:Phosphatidyl-myo-inositol mannosyltransferase [Pontiella sulfatireligans]|uniref:Phosphatidyl-myo-inositol mannosyltransferase n=1 Tax=Pontiella sulfatireligans TaxID=2750658 RepID=A0A6C2UF25_9BACT|nr:Phosphatidyl-myo-inositol mannosyltransferase [Pontiella sulfatireligans]
MKKNSSSTINRVAFVGNYLPRKCGIATFTTDLCEAVATAYADTITCLALPVNDTETGYSYPPRVRFELSEKDIESYRRAADFLNINNVDVVCLQHEYGIYGGAAGSHILTLLRELRMPVVTTLHTILEKPLPEQLQVLKEVAALSDRLVTMSRRGVEFLKDIYGVPPEKIDFIHHGVPDVPFADPNFHKDLFGVEGKKVLLSFGLLSASKGIETVISALPAIVARHPEVVYIVVGATHPNVLKNEGEQYRLSLQRLAQKLGVAGNVIFHNSFVTIEELIEFINAADIYITPYLNAAQITSGTLAYTIGAGKAVVSTPYWHAEELLADGRGALFPFRDSAALAEQVLDLLDHESKRHAMRKKAYLFGREMIWPKVAQQYMESFEQARSQHLLTASSSYAVKPLNQRPADLPMLKLNHLRRLTDDTGMIQHAKYIVPNYAEGYCIDDNARALIVGIMLAELELGNGQSLELSSRYLAFIAYAFNPKTERFRNFMDYQRNWLETSGSDDSQGRTLWALGTVMGRSTLSSLRGIASGLFEQAIPSILAIKSPRAWAFALIGIHEYLRRFEGDRLVNQIRDQLADRLVELYHANRSDEWRWFEDRLTYCNAVLPHAMLMCGQWIPNSDLTEIGLESLHWLTDMQRSDDHFSPIGSNGFYVKGGERARFDQQPVEAHAMASASLEAYRCTGDVYWLNEARRTFDWFLGNNDLGISLYDHTSGGCRDGLHPDRPNENQGAESTLAFIQTLLELRLAENSIPDTH